MFKKSKKAASADPLADFWNWWESRGASAFARAISTGGRFGSLPDVITAKVQAIDPELIWELSPGQSSQHTLCVSAGGDWKVRSTAERWLASAPTPTTVWEYAAAKRADPDVAEHSLTFAGTEVLVGDMRLRLTVDEERQLVDVGCFHPSFPTLRDEARDQLMFLVLDWTLGEDDVERWVGEVEALPSVPEEGLPLNALVEIVKSLAGRQGEDHWAIREGTTASGERHIVSVRRPLRWIDYPLFDQHLVVTFLPGTRRDPTKPENDLIDRLGKNALFVADETVEGMRALHFYADSEDSATIAGAQTWAEEHDATFARDFDPGWRAVQEYR